MSIIPCSHLDFFFLSRSPDLASFRFPIMAPLNIIIVGAGVAGPCVAIGLARSGHNVHIFERLTSTSDVGYAFRITPNSDRCLKYLGIDLMAGGAVSANVMRMYDAEGKLLRTVRENNDAEKATKGTSVFAHRVGSHEVPSRNVENSQADAVYSRKHISSDEGCARE